MRGHNGNDDLGSDCGNATSTIARAGCRFREEAVFGAEVAVKRVAQAGKGETARRSICHVVALSRTGVRLRTYAELPLGALVALSLPFGIKRRGRIVWAEGYHAICRFGAPLPDHSINELVASYDFRPAESDELLAEGHAAAH